MVGLQFFNIYKDSSHMSTWLQAFGPHPHTCQMPGKISHEAHQRNPACFLRPAPVCRQGEQVNRRRGKLALLLHTALEHLELRNTHACMLFIDFSSAFNTILPSRLLSKLHNLNLNTSLCNWVLDFLANRRDCSVWQISVIISDHQHRCPTRPCAQSIALHTVHAWLLPFLSDKLLL